MEESLSLSLSLSLSGINRARSGLAAPTSRCSTPQSDYGTSATRTTPAGRTARSATKPAGARLQSSTCARSAFSCSPLPSGRAVTRPIMRASPSWSCAQKGEDAQRMSTAHLIVQRRIRNPSCYGSTTPKRQHGLAGKTTLRVPREYRLRPDRRGRKSNPLS
jgi:hypothetical protein